MIVHSYFASQDVQADGRISVCEIHLDDQGNEYVLEYLVNPDEDINRRLLNHAAELNIQEEARDALT